MRVAVWFGVEIRVWVRVRVIVLVRVSGFKLGLVLEAPLE